jgi:hypothetical protein
MTFEEYKNIYFRMPINKNKHKYIFVHYSIKNDFILYSYIWNRQNFEMILPNQEKAIQNLPSESAPDCLCWMGGETIWKYKRIHWKLLLCNKKGDKYVKEKNAKL